MSLLESLDNWQDAFLKYTVPEISHLNVQLHHNVSAKSQEVRALIGGKNKDILKTSDLIEELNVIVKKQDEALSKLCLANWQGDGSGIMKFERDYLLKGISVEEKFVKKVIAITKRHPEDYITVARGIWLSHQFNIPKLDKVVANLEIKFKQTLTTLLLHGEKYDELSLEVYNELFLAYGIIYQLTPIEVLKQLLKSRLAYVTECLSNSSIPFEQILKMISNVNTISYAAFNNNSLSKTIQSQFDVYGIIDVKEFAPDLTKYARWLSEDITQLRAYPKQCIGVADTRSEWKRLIKDFGTNVCNVMGQNLPTIFNSINTLNGLVDLFNNVLHIIVENMSSLKALYLTEESFYKTVLQAQWTRKFDDLIDSQIRSLLSVEEELTSIQTEILEDKKPLDLNSDFIFSSEMVDSFKDLKGSAYANTLIARIGQYCSGDIGDIKPVSKIYQEWLISVSDLKAQIDRILSFKTILNTTYFEEAAFDEIPDEEEVFWLRTQKHDISKIHDHFAKHMEESLNTVRQDFLGFLAKLNKKNESTSNGRAHVLILRAVLLIEQEFSQLLNSKSSDNETISLIRDIFECLAKSIDPPSINNDAYTESKASSDDANAPSLFIGEYLTTLVTKVTSLIGEDDLIWNHEYSTMVREHIIKKILTNLNDFNSNSQVAVDILYLKELTGVQEHLANESEPVLKGKIKDIVKRTRLLYMPISV